VLTPLTAQTRHLIGARELALMQPTAFLVNAARGAIVDERALIAALQQGQIAGAGLDVFEQEPLDPASPLLGRADVIATSHIAGVTDVSYRGIARGVVANIVRILAGQPPFNCVNWDALSR